MTNTNKLFFPLVDPLRGFAALSVLIYHVIETCQWRDFPDSFGLVWFRWGWMGVDIFFVISGFVITLSALNLIAIHGGDHGAAAWDFLGRRFRRIAPLFYATMVLFLLVTPEMMRGSELAKDITTHLLFIHNWYEQFHRSINAPSWTLGAEFQFYVILILFVPLVTRRNLPYVVGGALLVSWMWRWCGFYLNFDGTSKSSEAIFVFVTQLPGMIEFFVFGMAAAFFVRTPFFSNIRRCALFRVCLFCAIVLCGALSMHIFMSYEKDFWQTAYAVIFFRTLLALWFTSLILFLCSLELTQCWRVILAPFIYLGVISYGIYLIHWPVLMQIKDRSWAPEVKLIATIAITVCMASFSWHFYEKRFLRR